MQRAWFASRCIIGFFSFSFPFYLPSVSLSRLSSPAILVSEIFPCKGTASVRSSSTAALTGPRIKRQPSANQRFGYSVKFPAYLLAFAVLFPLLDPHVKSIPKGSRKEPFIKNGFGTKWIGCMVDALGKDWNEVSCRGEWANLEINGDTLRFTTETAWTPCNEVLDFACQFFRHSTTIIRRKNRDVSFIVSNNSLLKKGYIFTDMPFLCC